MCVGPSSVFVVVSTLVATEVLCVHELLRGGEAGGWWCISPFWRLLSEMHFSRVPRLASVDRAVIRLLCSCIGVVVDPDLARVARTSGDESVVAHAVHGQCPSSFEREVELHSPAQTAISPCAQKEHHTGRMHPQTPRQTRTSGVRGRLRTCWCASANMCGTETRRTIADLS